MLTSTQLQPAHRAVLHARLRRPAGASSAPGSLPVLFFGNLFTARAATVALNPSDREYLDPAGDELDGARRRFETLASLQAPDRPSLSDEQCDRAVTTMRRYFEPGRPVFSQWFRPITELLAGLELRYDLGQVAHLDLVQEATRPTWSKLPPDERHALREADEPFLRWQLEVFPLDLVVCNGRTPFEAVQRLTGARIVASGSMALVTWYVALADLSGRTVRIAGWNRPLQRPTGLGKQGHLALGRALRERIDQLSG